MGIIKRGILGGFSNKVANVVGTSWKGRAVIKSLPLSVANPRTTPQVNQRNKFAAISIFGASVLGQWVKPLWDRFAGDISGYNAFCKDNKANPSTGGVLDYPTLVMSKGKMLAPSLSAVVADASLGTVAFSVTAANDDTWGQSGEEYRFLILNATTGISNWGYGNTDPGDVNSVTDSGLELTVGDVIHVWASVKRADGTQVSGSDYATTTVVV